MMQGFHVGEGWYFERLEDGGVCVRKVHDYDQATDTWSGEGYAMSPDTWASVVSSMSRPGENLDTFRRARDFHEGN